MNSDLIRFFVQFIRIVYKALFDIAGSDPKRI